MLRKCADEDISDEECEKVINLFYENYDSYLEEYIIPEVIAFYIASSFIEMLCGKRLLNNILILLLMRLI